MDPRWDETLRDQALRLSRRKALTGPELHRELKALWGEAARSSTAPSEPTSRAGLGLLVCRWPPGHPLSPCPSFLFFSGILPEGPRPWRALFNSRKTKATPRKAPWLQALRRVLTHHEHRPGTWLASLGTATYDLVTCWALARKRPCLVLVPPHRSQSFQRAFRAHGLERPAPTLLCCLPGRSLCPPAQAMQCRDRLLAALADRWILLEIRRAGTLERTLRQELAQRPRPVELWMPPQEDAASGGGLALQREFSAWVRPHFQPAPAQRRKASKKRSPPVLGARPKVVPAWTQYLYHYTRSRPGPWPGQGLCQWARDLLEDAPWADHTSLDTLLRILTEGRLRKSAHLIRGGYPVVSWTAVPPEQLAHISRWHPGLIRWTFEPYGVAVRRRALKALGARPVIYAPSPCYERLREDDRFRFQVHDPPKRTWKLEREWRLPGDLDLHALSADDWFAFVPTKDDADRLRRHLKHPVTILALSGA
ncbi:hypothetical protein SAMN02746041_01119 [Desulfacinum hydrothermale DSM 13146]|uniref:Uncharacterized protein n=1 Tax=Desulfacinum hydrothermale DSM 13146 TaxID=1121390 RepID=A0A1W1XBK7_9BACT|nr:hypothetical protein [Desulfacinum hydrothermale]SMC21068.1 hypothetical protein SAMN02746041_01119 [Desulfacinum hydrothermale DSM 13146]